MTLNIGAGEKVTEVEPSGLTAFGIDISSRYGKAGELVEMLEFCEGVAKLGLERFIAEVFYDSKAGICSFAVAADAVVAKADSHAMLIIAQRTITQFTWLADHVHFGRGAEGDDPARDS
ncbi:hypothetical protein [Luteibacter yeojuensis]